MSCYKTIEHYQVLVKRYPALFVNDSSDKSIKIITNLEIMLAQQELLYQKARIDGKPTHWFDLGLLTEDAWVMVLRDLVLFPNQKYGCYIRSVNRSIVSDPNANDVAILPLFEGKILLLRHFRHEARAWLWEIPRGFGEIGLSAEENARKEMSEETRLQVAELIRLNESETGISERVAYFLAKCDDRVQVPLETTEAEESIEKIRVVTISEFEQLLLLGEIVDSYSIRAFVLARLRKLL